LEKTRVGDSIAVNGACLTVVGISGKRFEVDLSPETLSKTTFGRVKTGERINIERALKLSNRVDGHLVSGHIDGRGIIKQQEVLGNSIRITVAVPETLLRYMIPKGSVAVDGISLTINRCGENSFDVSIIPHTAKLTTIGFKKNGDSINIETDMVGKYIERFMMEKTDRTAQQKTGKSSIGLNFLEKTGFL
ncbi:MAG TPA: riboflavin synthase, partial [Desulfobacterales bacterium]|nr:riboflavin synthase [Desulfobacterales bacterium]